MHVILGVEDFGRSVEFYERVFGWPRNERIDYTNYVEFFQPGGGVLGLFERGAFAKTAGADPAPAAPGRETATELYVRVEEVDGVMERLERAGAKRLRKLEPKEWGEDAAYFADPDGNVVAVARTSRA